MSDKVGGNMRELMLPEYPDDAFWEKCLDEADEKFKGRFVRIDKQAFILGCAFGYGAARSDFKRAFHVAQNPSLDEATKKMRDALMVIKDHWPDPQFTPLAMIADKAIKAFDEVTR
jgi:hypothetical protein